jgi:hypothetical protein
VKTALTALTLALVIVSCGQNSGTPSRANPDPHLATTAQMDAPRDSLFSGALPAPAMSQSRFLSSR